LVCIPTAQILLTFDSGTNEFTFIQDSIAVTVSSCFVGMTVLGENGEPKQLILSPTLWYSGFIATTGLLLTDDLGKTEAILKPDSVVVTVSFEFEDMVLLGNNVVTKELDLSPTELFC